MPVTYMPILKGKQGELNALSHLHETDGTMPIVEVVPWERERTDVEEQAELQKSVSRIAKVWSGKTRPLFIDVAMAELELDPEDDWNTAGRTPLLAAYLAELSAARVLAAPVIRGSSIEVEGYVRAVREAAEQADLRWDRAVIRFTAEDLDESVAPLRDVAEYIRRALDLSADQVDILMDFGSVGTDDVLSMSSRLARFVVPQFDGQGWRGVTIGAGSFPVDLSEVTAGAITTMNRLEVELWQRTSSFLGQALGYADYAVTHPILPQGAPFAAPPQLRFAWSDHWLVSKGRRNDRRGHAQFFDICRQIRDRVGLEEFGGSWGDEQILLCANESSQPVGNIGPGNASTWRAIATSRHLSVVERRLADRDAP